MLKVYLCLNILLAANVTILSPIYMLHIIYHFLNVMALVQWIYSYWMFTANERNALTLQKAFSDTSYMVCHRSMLIEVEVISGT
jgi:hypothetical protein